MADITVASAPAIRRQSLPLLLAAAAITVQVTFPLLPTGLVPPLTGVAVLLFAAASATHAWGSYGRTWALQVCCSAAGMGFAAEALGVHTGLPFGPYQYHDSLGPSLWEVPLLVPLAWMMMAYPCLLLGRALGRSTIGVVAAGAAALASWDLFLDPQMVAAGHWTWAKPSPSLPGIPGIPLSNYLGWLIVATIMIAVLHRSLPARPGRLSEVTPLALLAWTWGGSTIGNLVFFDRPAVALWGGVAMGLTVVPYLRAWRIARAD